GCARVRAAARADRQAGHRRAADEAAVGAARQARGAAAALVLELAPATGRDAAGRHAGVPRGALAAAAAEAARNSRAVELADRLRQGAAGGEHRSAVREDHGDEVRIARVAGLRAAAAALAGHEEASAGASVARRADLPAAV